VSTPTRLARVAARWRSARGMILILLAGGIIFAAGSHNLTAAYSPDLALYERYANAALISPLFHSLPKEYPAAAIALFLAPAALPLPYVLGFSLLAAAGVVALVLSSDGLPEYPGWSRRTCTYLLVGTVAVVFARYDVFPALAAALAVEGARRERWGRAWAWAVAGGLLKLFPFLLLPGFLIVERAQTGRWPLRRLWMVGVPATLLTLAQLARAPGSLLSSLSYQLHRGFELSSLQGSLAFLSDPLHARWVRGFGSVELVGPDHLVISLVVTVAGGAALLAIWALARQERLSVVAVSLGVLSVAVLAEKSFAPQYLIWLAPFWAYWPVRRGWILVALLTTLIYPVLYGEAHAFGPGFYWATTAALVRNAVLLVATLTWLLEQLFQVRRFERQATSQEAASGQVEQVLAVQPVT
jgi:hypothetical protein